MGISLLFVLFCLALGVGYLIGLFNTKAANRMKLAMKFLRQLWSVRLKDLKNLPRIFRRLPKIFFHKRKLFIGTFLNNLADRP